MKTHTSRLAGVAALAAALSLAVTPAVAVDLPAPMSAAAPAYGPNHAATDDEYNHYRRYRGYRRHRGVDAGDVIAGVVVIGALAAILGSSRSRERDRDYRDVDYRNREDARYDRRDARNGYDSRGMENAVDMCIDQVDRGDERVETVDNAQRNRDGWYVSGGMEDGGRWSCTIDNDGRIRNIDIDAQAYSYGSDEPYYSGAAASNAGEQYDDDYYLRARATTTTVADDYRAAPASTGGAPAYPGGPLPGEEGYEANWQVDGDLDNGDDGEWEGDGRYNSAMAARP